MPDGTSGIIDNPITTIGQRPIIVPPGKFESPISSDNNFHNVTRRDIVIDGRRRNIELIHQLRSGDCVPATFLNTCSVEFDGKLPMSINEVRSSAIRMRQEHNESTRIKHDEYGANGSFSWWTYG